MSSMKNRPGTPGSSNQAAVPEAQAALDNMKVEIANELGIPPRQGDKGELPSRVAGHMVRRMIQRQEKAMSGQNK